MRSKSLSCKSAEKSLELILKLKYINDSYIWCWCILSTLIYMKAFTINRMNNYEFKVMQIISKVIS